MNNSEKKFNCIIKNENVKILDVGEKRQDNPKGNEQSENLTPSSYNCCFLFKHFE